MHALQLVQVDAEAAGKWSWGADVIAQQQQLQHDDHQAMQSCYDAVRAVAQELACLPVQTLQSMACHACG